MEKLLLKSPRCNLFEFDQLFLKKQTTPLGLEIQSYSHILGTDEAGRGPGAGGVFASCVYFKNPGAQDFLEKLNDSKKLSEKTRLELYPVIIENSIYSIISIDVDTIEKINILNSSLLAMKLAAYDVLKQIDAQSPLLLIDGNKKIKDLKIAQKTIVKGDSKSASIAAASILAKVSRDKYMREIDKEFPNYNWAKNKGYLTYEHIESIKKFGITKYHRKSFLSNILSV